MEEKKLTDEEIIKGLENWILHDCTAKQEDLINALDLIHRLQAENEELKSPKFASWKIKFFNLKEEFDKELSEHEEFTKKAKAEIERLKIDIKNEKNWGKIQTKQAVKDTAKEILRTLIEKAYVNECIDLTVAEVKAWFREDYGVEV